MFLTTSSSLDSSILIGFAGRRPTTTATITSPPDDTMTIIAAGNYNCPSCGFGATGFPNDLNFSAIITNTTHDFIYYCRVDSGMYGDRYYGRSNYYDYTYRGNGYDNLSPYYNNDQYRDFGYNNYYRCE